MTGHDQAKKTNEELKERIAQENEQKEVSTQDKSTEKGISLLRSNKALAAMYAADAGMGSENLGTTLPQLKVHTTGKSHTNLLSDGTEPRNGSFFYVPTQTEYTDVVAHILNVSAGYYAKSLEEGKDPKWTQLIAGMIINDPEPKPFIMFLSGLRVSRLWDFGKEAGKYTKHMSPPVPLFALMVHLTTEAIDHSMSKQYGKANVVNFTIISDENGNPDIVTDPREYAFLKASFTEMQEIVTNLVKNKSVEELVKVDEPY